MLEIHLSLEPDRISESLQLARRRGTGLATEEGTPEDLDRVRGNICCGREALVERRRGEELRGALRVLDGW